jgi:hypothetical protein
MLVGLVGCVVSAAEHVFMLLVYVRQSDQISIVTAAQNYVDFAFVQELGHINFIPVLSI